MKEHPILFNGEMVRAVLDGRKTQTRRTSKLDVVNKNPNDWEYIDCLSVSKLHRFKYKVPAEHEYIKCPYGVPGDRLWVRENFHSDVTQAEHEDAMVGRHGVFYQATEIHPEIFYWKPSIHMPRWASRILLEVVSVRVERVQDLTEYDSLREGVNRPAKDYRIQFKTLWNSINEAKGFGWDVNPWVWVVEFKVIK